MIPKTLRNSWSSFVVLLLAGYLSWWLTLDVRVVYIFVFLAIPIFLYLRLAAPFLFRPRARIGFIQVGAGAVKDLASRRLIYILTAYFVLFFLAGLAWKVVWVGLSPGFYDMEDGTDFQSEQLVLSDLESRTLFTTDVYRRVPHNTGEIRLRANRFGWTTILEAEPVYENGELLWRAALEPNGLVNQLVRTSPGFSQTSGITELSPEVSEMDLKYTENRMFNQKSKRRAWYANRFWIVGNGYLTTDTDGAIWWLYPRMSIKWFSFTYSQNFEGVTLVSAQTADIRHYSPDELGALKEFIGQDHLRVYPESLALAQSYIYGANRFGFIAREITKRSSDGESLYEIPGGQISTGAAETFQKYPILSVYNDELYWATLYEPVGGESRGARTAAIALIGADYNNAGEVKMYKFDDLEKNIPGVNKVLRLARTEVQNFEGWVPQQVQIYQDDQNRLYALSSIVSGYGSGQKVAALAGVNLLEGSERAYIVKTSDYSDLETAHTALLNNMFSGVASAPATETVTIQEEAQTEQGAESGVDERLRIIEQKVDQILERLE
ncbi:MAG: hypothetical protein CL963_02635 [Euryarchaeota archaeon]|jgi:hypothetical protein|nr:hypothetical protein [Euryarchaeota archaeon]HIK01069.1 hypothetical protein [Candidatus Undinarchaeales archaeon ERR594346 U_76725]|tara:strand:+ start:61063 stop:62718 length:1656 start_codon:yes stop_codon:yes gene_type:complete